MPRKMEEIPQPRYEITVRIWLWAPLTCVLDTSWKQHTTVCSRIFFLIHEAAKNGRQVCKPFQPHRLHNSRMTKIHTFRCKHQLPAPWLTRSTAKCVRWSQRQLVSWAEMLRVSQPAPLQPPCPPDTHTNAHTHLITAAFRQLPASPVPHWCHWFRKSLTWQNYSVNHLNPTVNT